MEDTPLFGCKFDISHTIWHFKSCVIVTITLIGIIIIIIEITFSLLELLDHEQLVLKSTTLQLCMPPNI